MIREHDAAGTIASKAGCVFELAVLGGLGKMLRLRMLIDNQISIHPVTQSIVLNNDASAAPFIQREVFALEDGK